VRCLLDPILAFDLFCRANVTALDVTATGNDVDARRSGVAPGSRAPVSRSRALLGGKLT
jgi:hypothetical protein